MSPLMRQSNEVRLEEFVISAQKKKLELRPGNGYKQTCKTSPCSGTVSTRGTFTRNMASSNEDMEKAD